ncbi:bifunctional RecB family nuclease/DEAD/DEAH box helicase [Cellulomonas fimi]|uniref:TM0106 family RecB-like putative nuclease n=1 Tax=Cellulomonas fimi TaxID=1708 RepID=A0A7Y0M0M2_CELFI|nr:bifunctional RecB family nuclease/DEAD/DEAH box helicase [Cellulomonas fimi]NMR20272.1 TM0106 family RecB-like putative nuclease [Cellulomonas fimi]
MFLLSDGTLVYSASDLANAAACEFAVLRSLDAKLGRIDPIELPADAMLDRAARLGDAHELRVLDEYRARFGPWDAARGTGVVEIERPDRERLTDATALQGKHDETMTALRTGADVVFQAGFFDGRFGGWADFLVRERGAGSTASGPVYAVHDTKLARHAKITAMLQLAAYGDQLLAGGITPAEHVHLVLGDRTITTHRLADLLPVYRDRRARLQAMLDSHQAGPDPVAWGDPGVRACGRCEICAPEVERTRDVLLVAGMRTTQRARLHDAGITTIERLAASEGPVEGIGAVTLEKLRAQARLQVRQAPDEVLHELFAPEVVRSLPAPDAGDLFFDFEGDPLWMEEGSTDWGLEYLFGVVEAPAASGAEPVFRPFWAHDRAQEKQALIDFLEYVAERRARYPDLHIYHYAPYEKTALLRLAGRHGVGEDVIDDLLRSGVLVDLYATVRASLRVGQGSYSLKKLEPLYMTRGREGDVTTAGDSIVEYADACVLRDAGDVEAFDARMVKIAEYNRYDCLSTLGLRDWLLAQAALVDVLPSRPATRVPPAAGDDDEGIGSDAPEEDELAAALLAIAGEGSVARERSVADEGSVAGEGSVATRGPERQAVAMLAASLGYHWREAKPFWWAHYQRLVFPPAEWTEPRGTLVADHVEVLQDWTVRAPRQNPRRRVRITGQLEPGSDLRVGAEAVTLYDHPVPDCARTSTEGVRGWLVGAVVVEVTAITEGGRELDVLVVDEKLPTDAVPYAELPMALGPAAPPPTGTIQRAIRDLATEVAGKLEGADELVLPGQPALDVLQRIAPRTRSGAGLPPVVDGGYVDAITAAVRDLDHSYLAVQGPPGTGKTYTGARVIASLVERGWRVGVVAQSHAVVENMLAEVARAGVPAERIGKKPAPSAPRGPAARGPAARGSAARGSAPRGPAAVPWRALKDSTAFAAFYAAHPDGAVVGGTAWDFANAARLPADGLDLLVIDEAGQFCLANTVAVSGAARNLLLLGDPQQLPQVSQGRHPEPVDRSALGWLTDGHETLPETLGYFLASTWRMHPALTAAVSRLSYENRLTSVPSTAARSLEGVEPGVRTVLVEHTGNAVASVEEAAEVVRQVRAVVGRRWHDPAHVVDGRPEDRPLAADDVVVVAAYNAQVFRVRQALEGAGLGGVRVGTVDKFQGQQAPVVILTTAASSADDVPRGMEFLLSRNRVNVAVSRGKWCAIIVRSATLTDYLPTKPEGLEELGAFLGLSRGRHTGR